MQLIENCRWRIISYVYTGMVIPTILLLILGAAIGGAVPNVPEWQAAYDKDSVGGVLAEMLTPAHGFGKFIVVILALSVIGNIAVSMYSISLNIQMFHPIHGITKPNEQAPALIAAIPQGNLLPTFQIL